MEEQLKYILVVDDQEINQDIIYLMLYDKYKLIRAYNGLEALDHLKSHKYNIQAILLDLSMPIMDGYTFIEKYHEAGFDDIPIIVMTGDNSSEIQQKVFRLGVHDIMVKPYDQRILLARVENVLMNQ